VPRDHLPPEYVIRPDGKYWRSYLESDVELPPEFVSLMAEVFGR
jgi:hypothetical protein